MLRMYRLNLFNYKKQAILILLILFSGACFSQVSPPRPPVITDFIGKFNFDLSGVGKQSHPYSRIENYNRSLTAQGQGDNFPVAIARHHIIPYITLQRFFNSVQENGQLRLLGNFFATLADNLENYVGDNDGTCSTIDLSIAGSLANAMGTGFASPQGDVRPDGFDTFLQFYTWMPGNLFYGPIENLRSDDPRDGFETGAIHIIGADRYNLMLRLYNHMRDYINGDDSIALIVEIDMDLSVVAGYTMIAAVVAGDWIYSGGRYSINPGNVIGLSAQSYSAGRGSQAVCQARGLTRAAFFLPIIFED